MNKFQDIARYIIGFILGLSCIGLVGYAFAANYGTEGGIGVLFEKLSSPESTGGSTTSSYRLDGENIKDESITNHELGTDAITTDKIKDGTIIQDDINPNFTLWNQNAQGNSYYMRNVGIKNRTPLYSLSVNGHKSAPGSANHAAIGVFEKFITPFQGPGDSAASINLTQNNIPLARLGTFTTINNGTPDFNKTKFIISPNYNITKFWSDPSFVLTASGKLGLGTSFPKTNLHAVNKNSDSAIRLDTPEGKNSFIQLYNEDNNSTSAKPAGWAFGKTGDNKFRINFDEQEGVSKKAVMVLNKEGNIGIGTTDPQRPLHIKTNDPSSTMMFERQNGKKWLTGIASGGQYGVWENTGAGTDRRFMISPGGNVSITNGGKLGIGTLAPQREIDVVGTIRAETYEALGSFRAKHGKPDSSNSTNKGFAFETDGDTGLFTHTGNNSGTAEGLGMYINSKLGVFLKNRHPKNPFVGIGTDTPRTTLDVISNQQVIFSSANQFHGYPVESLFSGNKNFAQVIENRGSDSGGLFIGIGDSNNDEGAISVWNTSTKKDVFNVSSIGNTYIGRRLGVGSGNREPKFKLEVEYDRTKDAGGGTIANFMDTERGTNVGLLGYHPGIGFNYIHDKDGGKLTKDTDFGAEIHLYTERGKLGSYLWKKGPTANATTGVMDYKTDRVEGWSVSPVVDGDDNLIGSKVGINLPTLNPSTPEREDEPEATLEVRSNLTGDVARFTGNSSLGNGPIARVLNTNNTSSVKAPNTDYSMIVTDSAAGDGSDQTYGAALLSLGSRYSGDYGLAKEAVLDASNYTSGLFINNRSLSGDIRFGVKSTEHMRIKRETGNVGIGTSTPESPLQIAGSRTGTKGMIDIKDTKKAHTDADLYSFMSFSDKNGDTYGYFGDASSSKQLSMVGIHGYSLYLGTFENASTSSNKGFLYLNGETGNFGVDTNNPQAKLEVNGDVNIGSKIDGLGAGTGKKLNFLGTYDNTDDLYFYRYNRGDDLTDLRLNIGDNVSTGRSSSRTSPDRFVIGGEDGRNGAFQSRFVFNVTPSPRLGIGVSNPTQSLHINGNVLANGYFYTSDQNFKKDISEIKKPLEVIKKLRGVSFTWKETFKESFGLIAQEVEKVIPELVHTDGNGYKSVEYANLVAFLIEGMKEQQVQIEKMEKQLKKQGKAIEELQEQIKLLRK